MDDSRESGLRVAGCWLAVRWQDSTVSHLRLRVAQDEDRDGMMPPAVRLLALQAAQAMLPLEDGLQEALSWAVLSAREAWLAGLRLEDARPGDAHGVIPLPARGHSMK